MAEQVGDSTPYNEKYYDDTLNYLNDDSISPPEYTFSYPLLMEAQIRRLKLSLEHYRELALALRDVFLWKKQWHPTALIGVSTVLFTLVWLLDPSVLTLFAMACLCITLCDYLVPSLTANLFKQDKWNPQKEKELEDLCTDLILYKAKMELLWASYYKMRITNRKMYFVITVTILILLAWIGCTFNNLFLSYLVVTLALLLPGMEHNGIIAKGTGYFQGLLGDLFSQAKNRIGPKKEE